MKGPTPSDAYAMIRFLKTRNEKGDVAKIAELEKLIEEAKLKKAARDVEKYFAK